MRTRCEGVVLVQTTDFFYPLIDDPYLQGRIACANVLSDLYAMGVADCDNMLMLLSCSLEMTPVQRAAITPLLIEGFNDLCREAGSSVNGGQTVMNPWTIIGGVASSVCRMEDLIMPELAEAGDVLVLTKPLGTQVAVNAHQWLGRPEYAKIADIVSPADVVASYEMAAHSMARLNRNGARLMHKYGSKGATDVTGFGFLGHAINLAENQRANVDFEIDRLILIKNTAAINAEVDFQLVAGYSAETSGGLLLALPASQAEAFCAELEALDGVPSWIVGRVVEGTKTARIMPNVEIVEVETARVSTWTKATAADAQ